MRTFLRGTASVETGLRAVTEGVFRPSASGAAVSQSLGLSSELNEISYQLCEPLRNVEGRRREESNNRTLSQQDNNQLCIPNVSGALEHFSPKHLKLQNLEDLLLLFHLQVENFKFQLWTRTGSENSRCEHQSLLVPDV